MKIKGVPPAYHAQDARATSNGTGVPPVDHAQDARATLLLLQSLHDLGMLLEDFGRLFGARFE